MHVAVNGTIRCILIAINKPINGFTHICDDSST